MNDDTGIEKIDLEKVDWRGSREFFESLTDELRSHDDKDEAYDFTWVGKRKSIIEAGAPINKTLRPDVTNSKNWDTTENLFIEGDNLDALKLLQESYLGKVKMIYIDPPYNTGKDFVYHDNFKASVEQYDEDTEYRDEEGNIQLKKNEKTNGRYHSDWLSMMYPRLKLARNLLSEDGVIFISIDDNEQANLKKLCDEVFGEDNFVAVIHCQLSTTQGMKVKAAQDGNIVKNAEYIICYSKNGHQNIAKQPLYDLRPKYDEHYSLFIKEDGEIAQLSELYDFRFPKDLSNKKPLSLAEAYEKSEEFADIVRSHLADIVRSDKVTGFDISQDLKNGEWKKVERNGKEYLLTLDAKGSVRQLLRLKDSWGKTDGYYEKEGLRKIRGDWWEGFYIDMGNVAKEGDIDFKNGKKPVRLIKQLTKLVTDKTSLILDFFSGSGTTAHAVMQQNAEDGGRRKWIMVQLPEVTDEKSEAYKAGYKTIPEIARERIRRAGKKIAEEHPDAKVDYGFRSLVIADTNFKDVYKPVGETSQESLLDAVDNIKEDRGDLDLLYGVLTATACELNKPLEKVGLAGATVYKYDYFGAVSGLVACFAPEISEETIKQIAALKPLTAVFRESSFPDSQAKVNLAEHFRILSPDTKVKVI